MILLKLKTLIVVVLQSTVRLNAKVSVSNQFFYPKFCMANYVKLEMCLLQTYG